MNISTGTSGFGYREWKGLFYPAKISSAEMLPFYASRFSTVEINNTFYRMPREAVLAGWAGQVPDDFVFSIKAPQLITHIKQLRDVGTETAFFFQKLSSLGTKLGPVLFQFPASFHPAPGRLEEFLNLIPDGIRCAFGFRSADKLDRMVPDLLKAKGYSLCIEDTDGKPASEIISTAPWGYLRLRRTEYREADLLEWRNRVAGLQWEQVYVYFKHEEGARGPQLASRFKELVGSGSREKRRAS